MNFMEEVITSTFDARDYGIKAATEFPETFSLDIIPGVKNQGNKPTCVAFAASSVLEYHYQKRYHNHRVFSTEFIYGFRDCFYYVGDGMMLRNALNTLKNYGDPFNTQCPGNNNVADAMSNIKEDLLDYLVLAQPHKISSYYRCNNTDQIKTALMNHGPVLAAMNTYQDYNIVDDIYTCNTKSRFGRHCVMIYGWNEKGWLVQNSWGKLWAGDGRFILPFDYKLNEAWGISDTTPDTDEIIIRPSNIKVFFYKLYNMIARFFIKKS